MPAYQYKATTADGREVAGQITASGPDDAQRTLQLRGLSVGGLTEVNTNVADVPPVERLNSGEAMELSQHVAQLSATRQPLAAGFRAAAEESGNRRVGAALRHIAQQIEQGQSLDNVLQESGAWLPRPICGVMAAAARTGNLAAALGDLVEHHRAAQSLRRKMVDGFAYSVVIAGLSVSVMLLLLFGASYAFERIFREFALKLPLTTRLLFWWRDVGVWLVLATAAIAPCAALGYRRWRGEAAWMRFAATIPLFGPLSYWLGVAEWSSLLYVLITYRVSLPEALRLCSFGAGHATLRELSRDLADGVSQGQPLSLLLTVDHRVPQSLVPLVSWGERAGALAEAFDAAREMFARRVEWRIAVLQAIVPPVLFIVLGCFVLMIAGGLFMPLWTLIDGLS